MNEHDFEALVTEVLADKAARASAAENNLRRKLAEAFERARSERGLTIRELAAEMETSLSQVQRLLHHEVGGSLTLLTVTRAADALGLRVSVHVRPCAGVEGRLIPFGELAWCKSENPALAEKRRPVQRLPPVGVGSGEWNAQTSWKGLGGGGGQVW